jgi:hypothetical protein
LVTLDVRIVVARRVLLSAHRRLVERMRDSAGMVSALRETPLTHAQPDLFAHTINQSSVTMVLVSPTLLSVLLMFHAQVRLHSDVHLVNAERPPLSAQLLPSAQVRLQFNAMMVLALRLLTTATILLLIRPALSIRFSAQMVHVLSLSHSAQLRLLVVLVSLDVLMVNVLILRRSVRRCQLIVLFAMSSLHSSAQMVHAELNTLIAQLRLSAHPVDQSFVMMVTVESLSSNVP